MKSTQNTKSNLFYFLFRTHWNCWARFGFRFQTIFSFSTFALACVKWNKHEKPFPMILFYLPKKQKHDSNYFRIITMDTVLTVSKHTMSLQILTNHMFGFHPPNKKQKQQHAHIIASVFHCLFFFAVYYLFYFCYIDVLYSCWAVIFFHGNFFF